MANAAGGHYQAVGGGRPQFPAYGASGTGGYYQQQQRPLSFQYYAPPPPQPPAPPGAPRFGGVSTVSRNPPPPPPPPPGEVGVPSPVKSNVGAGGSSFNVPPLQPPPLPPMFPWMSPALAESMTNSQYGQNFREAASNLPFVPIIVNDADLAKMTENVIKEAEQVKSHQLQYYKDVMNQDLPQALKDMFQPLYCKLCTLTLSSPVVAKDHYSGKRHKKGVDGWILKNPDLCTRKQVRDAAGQGGGGESSSQQQNVGGTVVKTPGGGMAVTGPINGYIMKQQQQQTPQPSPPVQPQQVPPQPLLSMNFENNRKRPAPSPQLQQVAVAPPKGLGPPQNTPQQAFNTTNKPSNNFIGPQKPEGGPSQSAKPPAQSQGVVLRNPGPPAAGNGGPWQGLPNKTGGNVGGGSDFQPKRPRREDETAQPGAAGAGPSQHHRGTEREKGGGGGGGGPPPKSLCEICNVQLSSKVQADQHFNGRNHKAKLAALQEGNSGVSNTVTPPVAIQAKPGISSGPSSTTSENSTSSTPAVAGVPKNTTSDTNPNSNIFNKLLALSSQSLPAPVQPPPEDGIGSSFDNGNPFNSPSQHQPFSKPRGGGGGGRGGAGNSGGMGRGGGGGRGGGNNPGRGGGRGNHNNSNNNNRGGGGGRGRGGGGGGPPFRNNANNSNKNNFNNGNNNRFNNNNRGRR